MGVKGLRPAGPPTGPDWTPGRSGGKVPGELGSGVLGWVWKLGADSPSQRETGGGIESELSGISHRGAQESDHS